MLPEAQDRTFSKTGDGEGAWTWHMGRGLLQRGERSGKWPLNIYQLPSAIFFFLCSFIYPWNPQHLLWTRHSARFWKCKEKYNTALLLWNLGASICVETRQQVTTEQGHRQYERNMQVIQDRHKGGSNQLCTNDCRQETWLQQGNGGAWAKLWRTRGNSFLFSLCGHSLPARVNVSVLNQGKGELAMSTWEPVMCRTLSWEHAFIWNRST